MAIKIIRKIDKLGRIVIPKDIRETFGIQPENNIEISTDDIHILISKVVREEK